MTWLTVTVSVDVPPERVWRAFTTAELAEWFWPLQLETSVTIDARVGAQYRVASVVADMAVSGQFTVVDEPNTLEFTWKWDGEADSTRVAITFRDGEITVVHSDFGSEDDRDSHIQGWNDCLARLPF